MPRPSPVTPPFLAALCGAAWLLLAGGLAAEAPVGADWAREARLAAEIEDTILEGEPIYLEAGGQRFLGIHTTAGATAGPRQAVLILHGRGLHPDWPNVVHPLRTALPDDGWDSLAIQLPVLGKGAKYYDYVEIFPAALPRIDAALQYLREQGAARIVIIAHSCGAHMAMHWVAERGDAAIDGFIGIGLGATDYRQPMRQPFPLERMRGPVLDIYGGEDHAAVQRMAPQRLAALRSAGNAHSDQRVVAGADHDFQGAGEVLLDEIRAWLTALPP